jgi:recombination protein RecT
MDDSTTTPQPTRALTKRLRDCRTLQEAFATKELVELIEAAKPKFIDAQAMLRTWIQAASRQPLIYQADVRQALGAFQSLAFLGLQPNTHLNLAHVIPFKKYRYNPLTRKRDQESVELQVIIGYPGLIELAHRSGAVRSVHCDVVHDIDAERFEYEYGTNQHLRHIGKPPGFVPRANPLYAYAWFGLAGGGDQFEVMPWPEVEKIRNRSQSYRTAMTAYDEAVTAGKRPPLTYTEAPWVRDAEEMGKKTALRRGAKWVPKCPDLRAAAALEDQQESGASIDWGPIIDGTASPLDGPLPEGEPDREEAPDPGATASLQGDRPSAKGEMPLRPENPPTAPQNPATARVRKAPPPKVQEADVGEPFEAAVIDEWGEPASGVFTDPAAFAKAIVAHWTSMPARQGLTGALLEFNADAIAWIKDHGNGGMADVLAVLTEIIQPATSKDEEPPPVPTGDDEVPWGESIDEADEYVPQAVPFKGDPKAYLAAVKEAVKGVPANATDALAWAEMQEFALEKCPAAQRLIAVNAIIAMLGKAGVPGTPDWLAAMVKPKPRANGGKKAGADDDPDARLIAGYEMQLHEFEAMDDPAAAAKLFEEYYKSSAIQTQMRNLRARNEGRFKEAEKLFNKTYAKLHGGGP